MVVLGWYLILLSVSIELGIGSFKSTVPGVGVLCGSLFLMTTVIC
jgi:hypothetical protein